MSTINLRSSEWRPAHRFPPSSSMMYSKCILRIPRVIPRVIPVLQESGPDDVPDDLQPAPAAGPDVSWPCMRSV